MWSFEDFEKGLEIAVGKGILTIDQADKATKEFLKRNYKISL